MGLFDFGESYDTNYEEQRAANYEQQAQQAKAMRRAGRTAASTPVVTPNPVQPTSLKGTMTTPRPPAAPSGGAVSAAGAEVAPAGGATAAGAGPSPTGSPMVFNQLLDAMRSKLANDDNLTKQKNLIFTQLYDRPLTAEEKASLTPNLQRALESNDRKLIDMEVRMINDQIKGRKDTLDSAIQFYVDGYNQTLASLDKQREDARNVIDRNIQLYGSRAFSNVPDSYKRQIEQAAGYGEGYLDNLPQTLEEQNIRSTIANRGGGGGGGGGKGGISDTAQAVLNGTLKLEDLTPTERGKIAGELVAAGYSRTENLSAGQREQIDNYDTLFREAQNAYDILDQGLETGPVRSRAMSLNQIFGGSSAYTNFNSSLSNLNSILLKARSGAAVTPEEFERIKGFIPLATDSTPTVRTKLERFSQELADAKSNYILRATQSSQSIAKEAKGKTTSGTTSTGIKYTIEE